MKQTGFLHKTILLVAIVGWSLTGNAQRYETDHGRVYYGEELLMHADVRSFKDLGCGYAKDRHNVYLNGRVAAGTKGLLITGGKKRIFK